MADSPNSPPPGEPVGARPDQPVCVRHPDRATGLRCVRCDRPSCPECLRDASVGYQCVDCVNEGRRTVRRPRTFVGAEVTGGMVVTRVLIAVNVVAFLASALLAGSLWENYQSREFADLEMWPAAVYFGEWWRLLTYGFLHVGPLHLAFNMVALHILGQKLEPEFGRLRFLAVYLLSQLGGGLAVYLFDSVDVSVAGASGAVYGLMGALLLAAVRGRFDFGFVLSVVVLATVFSFFQPNLSLLAHGGGFVIGSAVTAGLVYAPAVRRERWHALAVGGAFALIVVMAFVRTGQLG
ncbi:rhomboid family intramembrane serine protease [Saccharothrix hoggarensis]|uniref:Rhomboid family intramembrane serine protease n=1 Tax=Saccharothrix hoggarensis TaxID=913853 RepID=A0ABW3R598_9PSEU